VLNLSAASVLSREYVEDIPGGFHRETRRAEATWRHCGNEGQRRIAAKDAWIIDG
jgi:hypothetical protein